MRIFLVAILVVQFHTTVFAQQEIGVPSQIGENTLVPAATALQEAPSSPILYKSDVEQMPIPLGRGYNSLTGELRGDCTVGSLAGAPVQSFKTDYEILLIKSSDEFRKTANLNGSAAFGFGIWKADLASQYYRSASQTKNTDYLFVRVVVEGPKYELNKPRFENTSDAGKLVQRGAWNDFRRLCGNYFIESIRVGGEFSAIYSFESESEEERATLQAQLKVVARGYGGGDVAFSEKISKHSRLKVKIVRNATGEAVPEDNIPALIAYAKAFPTKINSQTARPIEIIRRDYQTINPAVPMYRDEEMLIDKWARYLGAAYETLADVEFAKKNRAALYPVVSEDSIEALRKGAQGYIDNLELAARNCGDDPRVCKTLDPSVSEPRFLVPRKAQRHPLNPKSGVEQLIGVVGPDEVRKVVVLGQWSAWDNGDNLWWPPEQCCFSVVIQYENGLRDVKGYNPAVYDHSVKGPARVFVQIGDSTHGDNRGRDLEGVVY
jgi:hypothetical protein